MDASAILITGALRRAGDFGGSRRFLGLPLRAEIRIPPPEGILPLFVEHPSSYLQEKMCSTLAPSHRRFRAAFLVTNETGEVILSKEVSRPD